jgi:hypothetical protein
VGLSGLVENGFPILVLIPKSVDHSRRIANVGPT